MTDKNLVCSACGEPSETDLCKRPKCVTARTRDERQDNEEYESKVQKSERKSEVRTTGQLTENRKQPAYLKSVAQIVVPSSDPEAPYGRDDNDRPIGVLVGKPYVKPEQTGTVEIPNQDCGGCGQMLCRHCHPENMVQTDVLENLTTRPVPLPPSLEDNVRAFFGVPTPPAMPTPLRSEPQSRFVYFPTVLGISRAQMISLFEYPVTTEERLVRNEKVLMDVSEIKNRITEREAELTKKKTRITELKTLINNEEETIHSMSHWVQQLRRQPDDILPQPVREKYKREARQNILNFEKQKRELEKELRMSKSNIQILYDRMNNWGSNPDDYMSRPKFETMRVLFHEKFHLPRLVFNNPLSIPPGHEYLRDDNDPTDNEAGIAAYVQQVYLYGESDCRNVVWTEWRWFENSIIFQAITWGLIKPKKHITQKYKEDLPVFRSALVNDYQDEDGADDSDEDYDAENPEIIRTGGATIGGGIHGEGFRYSKTGKITERALVTFNKDRGSTGPAGPYGEGPADNFYGGMDSGDLSERGGDE